MDGKNYSQKILLAYNRNYGIPVRIARYHNIFGPEGTWDGGREKAPTQCRKVAYLPETGGGIEVWGDNYKLVPSCTLTNALITRRLMDSDFIGPVNIGSEEMVTINQLVEIAAKVSNKVVQKIYKLDAPTGVRGRNSNNDLIREKLGWTILRVLKRVFVKHIPGLRSKQEKESKYNLVGDTFTHLTNGNKGYSVHGKESKYIEWVKDGEITFYIDSTLPWAWMDPKPGPKYAWLLESKYITPQIVDAVKINPKQYLDTFDAIFTHNQELLAIDPKFKWCPISRILDQRT